VALAEVQATVAGAAMQEVKIEEEVKLVDNL